MFIEKLSSDPEHFVYVVVTMVFSIVLHELAHGWAAIWQGDRTPIETGHMTIDPRVHMGAISLIMLAVMGMCFGAMPVDPSRFRSRYGNALVSAAGPLMNLLLAFLALTGIAIWMVVAGGPSKLSVQSGNMVQFLSVFGVSNIALCLFNLIPIPPLDGATVLANLHKGYARVLRKVQEPRMFLVALIVVVIILSSNGYGPFQIAAEIAGSYVRWTISILM
ncbi:MAG: Zn-dependent protease [Planctomycetota bacterium]|jgi:Zn-dependent protease